MALVKIWIHTVWSTKDRVSYLKKDIRQQVFNHMLENARKKGIHIDHINGHNEHVHCLISLDIDQTIAKVLQLIKGESSFWINQNKICEGRFEWQDDYFAVSVSESQLDKVREYIRNQEEHHKFKTFADEYDQFMSKYKFFG